jgi:nitroreductase
LELDRVVARRKMCRNFTPMPVPPEAIDRALALALRAPSAGNTQGWAFLVLEGEQTRLFWEHEADASWRAHPSHPGLVDAPVVVLPLASRRSYVERYSEVDKASVGADRVDRWQAPYWLVDTSFATMLLLLGLCQEGLGALFFALRRPFAPLLAQLGVPAGWEPVGAVAIGWPSPDDRPSTSARRPRKNWEHAVHRGRWGGP